MVTYVKKMPSQKEGSTCLGWSDSVKALILAASRWEEIADNRAYREQEKPFHSKREGNPHNHIAHSAVERCDNRIVLLCVRYRCAYAVLPLDHTRNVGELEVSVYSLKKGT